MEPELVYDFAIESLFKGLRDKLTPELRAKAKALGIDPLGKLLPAYPREQWAQLVDLVSREVNFTHRELGAAITHGFAETAMGIIMKPAVVLMGVRRVLARLPRSLTMSNNFLKVAVHDVSPQALRVELSHDAPSADFLAGCIEEMARYAGAKECHADPHREGSLLVIDVSWR